MNQNSRGRRRRSRGRERSKTVPAKPLFDYGVVFFDTEREAMEKIDDIRLAQQQCDRLNIVIRAEGRSSQQDLPQLGKVYCGAAWTAIHQRRVDEGWYDKPQE